MAQQNCSGGFAPVSFPLLQGMRLGGSRIEFSFCMVILNCEDGHDAVARPPLVGAGGPPAGAMGGAPNAATLAGAKRGARRAGCLVGPQI